MQKEALSGKGGIAVSTPPPTPTSPAVASSITVAVRIRPLLERDQQEVECITLDPTGRGLVLEDSKSGKERQFDVDYVFDSRPNATFGQATQAILYESFGRSLALESLAGFNICMFAFGQTGSGKTYTMLGHLSVFNSKPNLDGEGAGLLPRTLHEIFGSHRRTNIKARYVVQYYEVYNERINDLLLPNEDKGNKAQPEVHFHPKFGGKITNITIAVVERAEEALQLLRYGNTIRTVAATTMNENSSRSHAIFELRYEHDAGVLQSESCVTVVDLAGRENESVTMDIEERFKEMTFINRSLFHLTTCITNLARRKSVRKFQDADTEQQWHDFRNTKLTMLLSHCLQGSCKTALLATVASSSEHYDDNLSTLRFTQSVRQIKTKPTVNSKKSKNVVLDLQKEIMRLQEELATARSDHQVVQRDLYEAEKIAETYKRDWGKIQEKSNEDKAARRKSRAGLGLLDVGEDLSSLSGKPCLVNLSDDPALQGCCVHVVEPGGQPVQVGQDPEWSSMILQGLGILPMMCSLSMPAEPEDPKNPVVTLQLAEEQRVGFNDPAERPRVLVNGNRIEESCKLTHGDRIIFGQAHAFRLVLPERHGELDAALDMDSALEQVNDERSEQFEKLKSFLASLHKCDEFALRRFVRMVHQVCPLIDQANLITKEVRPNDGLIFQLHVLTDLFDFQQDLPELVVCVLHKPHGMALFRFSVQNIIYNQRAGRRATEPMIRTRLPPSKEGSKNLGSILGHKYTPLMAEMGIEDAYGNSTLLYTWPLEKFLQRLKIMRDVYEEGSRDGGFGPVRYRFQTNPFADPWREIKWSELAMLLECVPSDAMPGQRSFYQIVCDAWRVRSSDGSIPDLSDNQGRAFGKAVTAPSPRRRDEDAPSKISFEDQLDISGSDELENVPTKIQKMRQDLEELNALRRELKMHVEDVPAEVQRVKRELQIRCSPSKS